MPFALWSILVVSLLPLLWTGIAKAGAKYDNHRPREVLAQASGYRQRANWAQQNAWEALPVYAAAMLVAWVMAVPVALLNLLAWVYVCARLAHGLCYLADKALLRSLAWLVAIAVVVVLFCKAGGVL
ncbi:MAPEG family protein [Neisseriaceae bacterium TC5R-5]|nr:MAPEG family protein [Neisseriaceae bacterium TC5R-5]